MAAEALVKALNNPTVLAIVDALHDTAQTTLEKLSKVYTMNTNTATPRVEAAPRWQLQSGSSKGGGKSQGNVT
jgi:DNA-binding transcriptional ArsR family regulator